jgi:hypothetical protein
MRCCNAAQNHNAALQLQARNTLRSPQMCWCLRWCYNLAVGQCSNFNTKSQHGWAWRAKDDAIDDKTKHMKLEASFQS